MHLMKVLNQCCNRSIDPKVSTHKLDFRFPLLVEVTGIDEKLFLELLNTPLFKTSNKFIHLTLKIPDSFQNQGGIPVVRTHILTGTEFRYHIRILCTTGT